MIQCVAIGLRHKSAVLLMQAVSQFKLEQHYPVCLRHYFHKPVPAL